MNKSHNVTKDEIAEIRQAIDDLPADKRPEGECPLDVLVALALLMRLPEAERMETLEEIQQDLEKAEMEQEGAA